MRLLETSMWMLVALVLVAILIGKINEAIAELRTTPESARFEIVDGRQVPFWPTQHRGEPVRIYICPGERPRLAIARQRIECAD